MEYIMVYKGISDKMCFHSKFNETRDALCRHNSDKLISFKLGLEYRSLEAGLLITLSSGNIQRYTEYYFIFSTRLKVLFTHLYKKCTLTTGY